MSSQMDFRVPEITNVGVKVDAVCRHRGKVAQTLQNKKQLAAAAALATLMAVPAAARADDIAAEIRELKEQLEPLKARIKQLESEVAKEKHERKDAKAAKGPVRTAAAQPPLKPEVVCKDAPCPPPPPPVFVNFGPGLKIESIDHNFSVNFIGRILFDGGVSSQAEKGYSSQVNITQARLGIDGKAFRYWDYKLEYDFAGSAPLTNLSGTTRHRPGV
jgi:hypothetical protein